MPSSDSQSELYKFGQTVESFARSYQFAINIEFPSGVTSKIPARDILPGGLGEKNITMLCQSMTLPQRTFDIEDIMVQYGKPPVRIARQVRYTPWSVVFRSPSGMRMRDMFLAWQDEISSTGESSGGDGSAMEYKAPANYKTDGSEALIKLEPNDSGSTGVRYKFFGMFPSDVSGVTFDHSDTGVASFSVELTYDYYKVIFDKATTQDDRE